MKIKVKMFLMLLVLSLAAALVILIKLYENLHSFTSNLAEKEIRTVQACWPAYTFETAVEEATMIVHGKVIDKSNTIINDMGHWVLVSYHAFGDWIDSYGWVKFSELIEYNEETINLLQGPFMLSEDAIDIETGELAHELLRGSWVNVDFKEDFVRVGTDGGIYCKVDKKYLIYPEYK